ncbi:decarboxylating NADP(+)-dependent phosphogluconate dehydrogenase [bacterium]|nr:decarboxylating NADP(+)-dependent phosphogluconate dehydrogenase [bacterium]
MKAEFGLVGLGVMGENLILNVERNGFSVAVWNRDPEKIDAFLKSRGAGKKIYGAYTPAEFAALLLRPRKILLMVKAGDPVDWTISQLLPHLEPGDIVIDGGNSHFPDTVRREKELAGKQIRFLGAGISGGETGALWGPSIMPGGNRDAYEEVRPVFEAIAAKVEDGPCVTYIGSDGAGHFVKMVHNGIEYGDMQLIAEAYDILRQALGLNADELADVFARWNEGPLNSYLIEITAKIFTVKDPETGQPLVDLILDKAGQKGTGQWTIEAAVDLGVAIPTIHAALEARFLSALKQERVQASRLVSGPEHVRYSGEKSKFVEQVHDALYASKICSYAQGMALIRAGSLKYDWNIDLSELSRIWKGGCIIRARFLNSIKKAFRRNPSLPNLLIDSEFSRWLIESQPRWRKTVSIAQTLGIPFAAQSASLAYFDSYRAARLPLNLTQAQRDFFGSHLYERIDEPELGLIHTDWAGLTESKSEK